MGIKLIKKTTEAAQRNHTFHLTTKGDMIGGFGSESVRKLAAKSDIPLYLLSKAPNGTSEMVKVISTKVADAKRTNNSDPADWGDGYVLVVDGTINPWGVNWLTIDDNELVYIKIADLSKAVEFLTA